MESKNELGHEVKKTLEQLATLRDEIRVRLHLAGMEARDAWNRMEPRLFEAETHATDATHAALQELTKEVKRIRDSIVS